VTVTLLEDKVTPVSVLDYAVMKYGGGAVDMFQGK